MRHVPTRMCSICKKRLPKSDLARFTLREGGILLADPRQVLPGRGCYLCPSPACGKAFEARRARKKCKGV